MKKILLIAIVLALILPIVYAADYDSLIVTPGFDVEYTVLDDIVSVFEEAKIEMVVVNKLELRQRFRIKEFSDSWELRTSPISVKLSGISLAPSERSEPFFVYLDPEDDLKIGQYELLLYTKYAVQEEYHTIPITLYIGRLQSEELQYLPSVAVETTIPKEIDPREEVVINIELDNLNRLNITDLVVHITSEDDVFVGEEHTSLLPLEKDKKVEIRKSLDPLLSPQNEDITLIFKVGGYVVKTVYRTVAINDYTGSLTPDESTDKRFLKTVRTLLYTNEGNAPRDETVTMEMSSWKNLVTRTNPKAKVIKNPDGKRYLAWDLSLAPQEISEVITVTTSYRLLVFLILVALLYMGYWYITKSPIVVKKSAEDVHSKEGGITALKVILTIKNPTKNTVRHIKVIDKVPSLADVLHEFDVGTLKPSKILRHEREGTTLIKWELEALEPFEERILVYKIKPQLSIVGGFTLPPVVVRYRKNRQEMVVRSTKLVVKG